MRFHSLGRYALTPLSRLVHAAITPPLAHWCRSRSLLRSLDLTDVRDSRALTPEYSCTYLQPRVCVVGRECFPTARSSGGRPSGPRARPGTAAGHIAASSGKRSHDPARRSRVDTAGRLPNAPTTAKFRSCRAPADTSGCNGLLPAPLRFVHHGKRRAMPVPQRVGIRRLGDNFLPKS